MAVTKIKAIRGTLNKALAYVMNPEKTDGKMLISSYGCAGETAAQEFEWTRKIAEQRGMNPVKIIARHVIQSFDVGEVSPELAHEIGKQFADEILCGKYEYVLTTHIDKGHVHNHLIFNAVDFIDHHAYKSYKKIYYDMRQVSDRLCKENGLSVIPPSQGKGMGYKEYTEAKSGTSWKQKLRQTIDRNVITAKDFDAFLLLMEKAGYEIKRGKHISFRAVGQERFTRAKTIGENYTEERLIERIKGRAFRRVTMKPERKGINLIIDIQNSIKAQESKGYEHWAKINNLKQAAKTLNYLTENNLLQYTDLEARQADISSSISKTTASLKTTEKRLKEVQLLTKHITQYQATKPVYEQYKNAKDKKKFYDEHTAEIIIFESSRDTLNAIHGDVKLPGLNALKAELTQLAEEQQRLYDERNRLKKEQKTIETVKTNVDGFLSPDREANQREQVERKGNNRE